MQNVFNCVMHFSLLLIFFQLKEHKNVFLYYFQDIVFYLVKVLLCSSLLIVISRKVAKEVLVYIKVNTIP